MKAHPRLGDHLSQMEGFIVHWNSPGSMRVGWSSMKHNIAFHL